jgi:hypothetical protein
LKGNNEISHYYRALKGNREKISGYEGKKYRALKGKVSGYEGKSIGLWREKYRATRGNLSK